MERLLRRAVTTLVLGGLPLVLAACPGTSTISYTYLSESYRPQDLGYAAKRGGMLTEVSGNPFTTPKSLLDETVTTAMEEAHFGPDLDFFTQAPEGFSSAYWVVVLFNPAPGTNAAKLCSEPARPQIQQEGSVGVLASFCSSDTRINSASGSLAGATGPDDPAFKDFMRQLSLSLFPAQNPNREDKGDFLKN